MSEHLRQIQSDDDNAALPARLSALLPDSTAPTSDNGAGDVAPNTNIASGTVYRIASIASCRRFAP